MRRPNDTSQPKLNPLSMDRKTTIKKFVQLHSFNIYQDGNRLFRIQISPNSTVGQLIAEVKSRLGQNSKDYLGLMSRQNNQIIDYTLKQKNFQLSQYPNNFQFDIQRCGQVQNDKQPSLKDFQFLKLLGSGVSANVFLVRHKCNGILYALKQIKKDYFKDFKRMEQVLRERKIMIQMITDIPFTSRLMASFQSQRFLNLVLEYYPGGEMFFHLQKRRLFEHEAKLYVAQMIVAFEKLHERKIIYRDLKPENIMIDFDGHARLGDFGLCKINLDYYDLTYSYCGSEEYMAPQVRTEQGYNYSVDFYTLGSFAYELVFGVPPYYNNEPLTFHQSTSEQFENLVVSLIESNMHKRLKSFNEIKRHKWFRSIQWKKIIQKKYDMPFKLDIKENYIGQEFKNQIIDPQICEEQRFDKLLECFFFLNEEKGGISQFYGRKKEYGKKSVDSSSRKKNRMSFQNQHQQSRKSSQSKNSYRSSKSNSKDRPNGFRKQVHPGINIYTSEKLVQKSSKKLFNSGESSKSKNKANSSTSQNKSNFNSSQSKKLKKSQKMDENPQKITIKKIKSANNLVQSSTFKKVMELQNVFSPRTMKSPKKMRQP